VNVLLVNAPSNGVYYKMGLKLPPLGVAYLAAYLRGNGKHSVDIIDMNAQPVELQNIPWRDWDVVGISGDTSRHNEVLEIAAHAKEAGRIVVTGGYHVTFLDEEALRTGNVDYVVRGEGEEIFAELVDALADGGDISKVNGISYLDADGNVVRTPDALPVQHLDELPMPARDLLPMKEYKSSLAGRPLTTMVSSRGCPYNCTFCSSSEFAGIKWRCRSPQNIADEIENVVDTYGYRAIAFLDDNFTINPKHVIEICDELQRRGIDVAWWCFSRVDTIVKNVSMVERMAESGLKMVFLGLESGSKEILDKYHKKITTDIAAKAVEILKGFGIRIWGSFIVGGLDDTKETVRQTVTYAKQLGIDIAEFSVLTPFPGTALYKQAEDENLIATRDWSKYDGAHAVMNTHYMTQKEIIWSVVKAYLSFYGRPSRWWEVLSGAGKALSSIR
jgi:anaerobic magnesium-protoporphyrin IX monomethyl ester cyclase